MGPRESVTNAIRVAPPFAPGRAGGRCTPTEIRVTSWWMRNAISWLEGKGAGRKQVRILFTSAGRRVELIQAFRRAARALGLRAHFHVADAETEFAAAGAADQAHHVPRIRSREYIPALLDLVGREHIDLLFPLLDGELVPLSDAREQFAARGCGVVISSPRVVRVCRDKLLTYEFLTRHKIDTPRTWTPDDVLGRRRHEFPYFLKPRCGSASMGNSLLKDRADLKALVPRVPDAIVQEFVPGVEHTLDVYTGYNGVPRCVVPRVRIEVRGGEVTKARTARHEGIIATGARVAEALGGCMGPITIQLILTPDGRIRVIEINPRFGGGVPLAIHAGADSPRWLLMEWQGRRPRIRLDHFRDGVLMLRYHQSFFK
jgi:carbamoyl-phosphate synthase large subunit